jgi:hypothetical protein
MSDVRSSAGSTLKISASLPATFNASGYSALMYTNIAELTNIGSVGEETEMITHNPIATRGVVKVKGSKNLGSIDLEMAYIPNDPGQQLLQTAQDDDADYAFEMTLQDNTKVYFLGKVTSFKINVGSVNDITSATAMIERTYSANGVGEIFVPAP